MLWGTFQAKYHYLQCHNMPPFVPIPSCGLLKCGFASLMQFNSTFSGLLSLCDSLLSPVTYFGCFLKGSQRKHFHFCSHLLFSNRVRWRDSWLEVGREEGYAVSGDRHMGRWRVRWLDGGNVHRRLGEAQAVRGQMRCDFNNMCLVMFPTYFFDNSDQICCANIGKKVALSLPFTNTYHWPPINLCHFTMFGERTLIAPQI